MPTYVIGLDLGADAVKAAVLKGSFRGWEVEDFLALDVVREEGEEIPDEPNPSADDGETVDSSSSIEVAAADPPDMAMARAVTTLLETIDRPQAQVVVGLPGSAVSTWLVDMPFADPKRLTQTLPFEMENYVPWDLDEVVLDYQVASTEPDGSAKVFSAMAPRRSVARLLATLAAADVDPRYVTVDVAALASLPGALLEGTVLLDVGASRTLVCVGVASRAAWVRSFDAGTRELLDDDGRLDSTGLARYITQLRPTLLAAEQAGHPVERIEVCGGGALHGGLLTQLEADFGVEAVEWELPVPPTNPEAAPTPGPEHALAYALAMRAFQTRGDQPVDFRRGEFAYQADSRLYTRLATAGVAALLFLMVGVVVMHFVTLNKLTAQQTQIEDDLVKTVQNAFPEVPAVSLASPRAAIAVMQEKVLGIQQRAEALRGPTTTPLTALKELSEAVPKSVTVNVDEFLVTDEMIRIRGITGSYTEVDTIEAAVKKNPRFAAAEKSDVSKTREGKARFIVQAPREPGEGEDEG